MKTENMSAAFVKELMRRSAQFSFETNNSKTITIKNVNDDLEEMLFSGGKLNVKLLGGKYDNIPD